MKKLRNKKTREIGYLYANKGVDYKVLDENDCTLAVYDTLSRLIKEWEEYEEPKEYWCVQSDGFIFHVHKSQGDVLDGGREQMGNLFLSHEEAEKVVRKLKALKRLKDRGLKFEAVNKYLTDIPRHKCELSINAVMPADAYTDKQVDRDLDTCFGGKE